MATEINLDMDPRKVLDAMKEISKEAQLLAGVLQKSFAEDAARGVKNFETQAETSTNKIGDYFRNVGTKIKEDMKTAFDATGILAGAKFAREIGEGVKQVFEMERAFDRLNTRLGLTGKGLQDFKKQVGDAVSATGQKLQDVLPGVETAAARGGIKDAGQLASIGQALGQARGTTGEDTKALSESVIEIMKRQGQAMTGQNFKATLDAVQGTRVAGAFGNADEAAEAIKGLSSYGQRMHMGSRELGGLAATASSSGENGTALLQSLIERAAQPGQQTALNSMFGRQVFGKDGKLDASELGKVDTNRFGQYSQQALGEMTGLNGAQGTDLKRFVDAFKGNMGAYDSVIKGANETTNQFDQATDNMASKIDQFKSKVTEGGRQVGDSIAQLGNDLLKGNFKALGGDAKGILSAGGNNAGVLAAAGGMSIGAGMLMGGGINSLLKKLPGGGMLGGVVGGAVGAEVAKATGVTPVYVTNAGDMKSDVSGLMSAAELAGGGGSVAGGLLKGGGKLLGGIGMAGGALSAGMAIGDMLNQTDYVKNIKPYTPEQEAKMQQQNVDKGEAAANKQIYDQRGGMLNGQHYDSPEALGKAIGEAAAAAQNRNKAPVMMTNPSSVKGRMVQ